MARPASSLPASPETGRKGGAFRLIAIPSSIFVKDKTHSLPLQLGGAKICAASEAWPRFGANPADTRAGRLGKAGTCAPSPLPPLLERGSRRAREPQAKNHPRAATPALAPAGLPPQTPVRPQAPHAQTLAARARTRADGAALPAGDARFSPGPQTARSRRKAPSAPWAVRPCRGGRSPARISLSRNMD